MKPHYACLLGLCLSGMAGAGELVYQPINPSFGGDPFNGSYLLGKAQAQDTHKDPSLEDYTSLTATERMIQSLQSRLLADLVNGVEDGQTGSFVSDDYSVVVDNSGGALSLEVTDLVSGDVTSIQVGGLSFNP
ncbi:curli production assembly/transport protein CsgF [Halomonas shantousis]